MRLLVLTIGGFLLVGGPMLLIWFLADRFAFVQKRKDGLLIIAWFVGMYLLYAKYMPYFQLHLRSDFYNQ